MTMYSPFSRYLRTPVYAANYCFHDPNVDEPHWFTKKFHQNSLAFHNHLHKETEILVLLRGHLNVSVGDTSFILAPGDALIVNPYEIHQGIIDPSEIVEYTYTVFDLRYFTGSCGSDVEAMRNKICGGELTFPNHIPAGSTGAYKIAERLRELLSAYTLAQSCPVAGDCLLTGSVCSLLGELFAHACPAESPSLNLRNVNFIQSVHSYIRTHYAEDLTTERVAAAFGYNKSYFCTLFKRNFSVPFNNYLNEFRVDQSTFFLQHNPIPLTEIAAKVGFSNYGYFSRSFRKHMGVSPSMYFKW